MNAAGPYEVDGGVTYGHPGIMSDPAHVVILGAGHAGGTAAALLRQYGFEGAITLVGEEPIPPYQRPPLSKAWLSFAARLSVSERTDWRGQYRRSRHQ